MDLKIENFTDDYEAARAFALAHDAHRLTPVGADKMVPTAVLERSAVCLPFCLAFDR
jgi:hypothetical protein